jgi:predicted transcriptional regulator of viral defense system
VPQVKPREVSDFLLSHGRPVVTLAEVAELLGVPEKDAAAALVRLRRSGQMFSPQRGLYVAVPPQYRTWGTLPALDFVDPMMTAGGFDYYVALLSAAELHGAAHQRPQVFQVMVDRPIEDRDYGRVRVRFYQSGKVTERPTELRNSSTGQVRVATPAVTALDLCSRPQAGGGLSNVATVVGELAEEGRLALDAVLALAGQYPAASLRRLGWLLDFVNSGLDTDPLREVVEASGRGQSKDLLRPGGPRRGPHSQRWGIVENVAVEPDL